MPLTDQYLNQGLYDKFNQALGNASAGGGVGDQYISQFMQAYKNLTGKDAGIEQIQPFIQNAGVSAAGLPGDLGYGDLSSLVNNYIQQSFPDQVSGHAQQQQMDQLGKTQQTIQDLIGKQTAATAADLTNPQSPTYQSFSGLMNNMGITPSSGAFQAGMGGVLGQNAANAENAALGGVSLPALSGMQGLSGFGLQNAQGNSGLGHLNQLGDFGLQQQLAQMLADRAEPSGAQKDIGMASGASNAAKNFMNMGPSNMGTSYVCKELIKRGLICESDMDDFHIHIMPALFKKGRAFWKYAMDGYRLVQAVNKKGLDWKVFKPLLFDRVMDEPDACKAVDLYADACHQLCISADRSLWDERVYRTSLWDGFPFLPFLFCYRPFLEALWKCVRVKLLFIYDKPHCEVHRGA